MGASFFRPICSVPLYEMASVEIARGCGRLSGTILSVIVTIIVLIIGVVLFFGASQTRYKTVIDPSDPSAPPKRVEIKGKKQWWILGVTAGIILFIWIVIPWLMGYTRQQRYKGYQHELESLQNQGYSRKDAIAKTQELYSTKLRADATRGAGRDVAAALWMRGN